MGPILARLAEKTKVGESRIICGRRREKGEGRREKGEGRREKGEGRRLTPPGGGVSAKKKVSG